MVLHGVDDALALLERLGAPPRLLRHHGLVVEAANELVVGLERFAAHFDAHEVLLGAALHDAGKILHPHELDGPGNRHELDGRALLTEQGLGALARFCVTHAQWDDDTVALEDLLVALADKLWKGKRTPALEQRVIAQLAARSGLAAWEVFTLVDERFELVASRGHERLGRS